MLPIVGLPAFDCPRSREATNALGPLSMPQSGWPYKKLLAYCEVGGSGFLKMNSPQEDRKALH